MIADFRASVAPVGFRDWLYDTPLLLFSFYPVTVVLIEYFSIRWPCVNFVSGAAMYNAMAVTDTVSVPLFAERTWDCFVVICFSSEYDVFLALVVYCFNVFFH